MSKELMPTSIVGAFVFTLSAYANFGDPLPGLTAQQMTDFQNGKTVFQKIDEIKADGLGPVFNEAACVTCHLGPAGTAADGAVGGTTERTETRFGKNTGGVFDPLANEGGSLIQDHAIGAAAQYFPNPAGGAPALPAGCENVAFVPEIVPADANVTAGRRTTPLFGLGLPNALSDNDIIIQAILEQIFSPFTAGTISFVSNPDPQPFSQNRVGRFGWKAQVPTLHVFSGDAYLNEMGITNPSFPNESCPQGNCALLACNPFPNLNDDGGDVNNFTNFMSLLAPPPRGAITASVQRGQEIFEIIGCADCHRPTWQTGPNPVAALSNKIFEPYTDFLLHDMGNNADGITQNLATGRLMRTTPLWGLRAQTALWHDGRFTGPNRIANAIEAHDASPEAFIAEFFFDILGSGSRADVLNFLNSL